MFSPCCGGYGSTGVKVSSLTRFLARPTLRDRCQEPLDRRAATDLGTTIAKPLPGAAEAERERRRRG